MPGTRFELVHPCECHPLKMVRLPISPPGLLKYKVLSLQFSIKNRNYRLKTFLLGCARRETRTLKRQFSTASETATFTNFAIRALQARVNSHYSYRDANIIFSINMPFKINIKCISIANYCRKD